jgi:hypothetical protein
LLLFGNKAEGKELGGFDPFEREIAGCLLLFSRFVFFVYRRRKDESAAFAGQYRRGRGHIAVVVGSSEKIEEIDRP